MSSIGQQSPQEPNESAAESSAENRVSFLDQVLWRHFSEAAGPEAFTRAWLALQCGVIAGVRRAVLVLGEPDEGPFAPAASWPDDEAVESVSAVAEMALRERRGVVQGGDDESRLAAAQRCHVAYPFIIERKLYGVVAMELQARSRPQLRAVMRQLQWGAGWIEVMLRRDELRDNQAKAERTAAAFDLVAGALEAKDFRAACTAAATELARRLDCDLVSIGFSKRRRSVVVAVSHAAQFGKRMNLLRDIGAAMDEAIDQRSVVVYPLPDGFEYRTVRAHAELARTHATGTIMTVPLHRTGHLVGAITFERPVGVTFDAETIDLCDAVAGVLGPILDEKRLNDRWIGWKIAASFATQFRRLLGPRYFGRKLVAVALLAAVGIFAIVTDVHRVTAPLTLEGDSQRLIAAPFDSYIAGQHARAGDVVREGDPLATLDDRDLALERLRWSSQQRERLVRYHKAMAEGQRAEAKIVQAQIDEANAQLELLDAQIARTKVRAPLAGMIISGDLSQSVGAAVRRGELLFKIAPLDSYRVVLDVDESDLADVRVGQRGTMIVSALPNEAIPYTIERITPITEAKEGRNAYRVEARLDAFNQRLRPGMTGIGKTETGERLLIWIWTKRLIDWVRLSAWRWVL